MACFYMASQYTFVNLKGWNQEDDGLIRVFQWWMHAPVKVSLSGQVVCLCKC